MNAELDIKPFLKAIREFHIAEQQPCGVQVVERVGLVANRYLLILGGGDRFILTSRPSFV